MTNQYKDTVKKMEEAEATMHKEVDTDIDSQLRTGRQKQLQNWSRESAQQVAEKHGLVLTDEHYAVIQFLQDNYIEQGLPDSARVYEIMLEEKFASKGGKKFLHRLFPNGPVNQGSEIAGIPTPAHADDSSFGTAR